MKRYLISPSLFLCLILLCACSPGHLKKGPLLRLPASDVSDKVGIEATFTNTLLQSHERVLPPELDDYLNRVAARIEFLCPDCRVATYMGPSFEEEVKVTFPDGFTLNLGRDHRVIEVTATPIEKDLLVEHTKKVQDILITAAAGVGLRPAKHTGGGHLHFDFEGFFKNDPQLLRDWFVDSYNNAFLFEDYLGGEPNNAPSLQQLPRESQENFFKLISDFDERPFSIYEFIKRMDSEVYNNTYSPNFTPPQKYQAISLIHALKVNGTIEFRNVRPYQQGQSIELLAKALLKRRDYLIERANRGLPLSLKREYLTESLSERERLASFVNWLKESRLNPRHYFGFINSRVLKESIKLFDFDSDPVSALIRFAHLSAFDDKERFESLLKSQHFSGLDQSQKEQVVRVIVSKVSDSEIENDIFSLIKRKAKLTDGQLATMKRAYLSHLQGPMSCGDLLGPVL